MAEREGFEPSERYQRSLPFQDSAIDHSAISPESRIILEFFTCVLLVLWQYRLFFQKKPRFVLHESSFLVIR